MASLLIAAADVFRPAELMVTAGLDGKHMESSLHYKGLALDFRTNHLPPGEKDRVVTELRLRKGELAGVTEGQITQRLRCACIKGIVARGKASIATPWNRRNWGGKRMGWGRKGEGSLTRRLSGTE